MVTNSGGVGVGPQVNKFEPVSSDDHQMSVEGGLGPMAAVGGGGRSYVRYRGRGWGPVKRGVPCIMGNGHMDPTSPHCENIFFPSAHNFVCGL